MGDSFKSDNRPYTHEGLAPVPPDGSKKSSRSYRTVSPRQITLYERWAPGASASAPTSNSPHSARRVSRPRPGANSKSVEVNDGSLGNQEEITRANAEFTAHDFLKPTSHTHVYTERPITASVKSTQYPSLSERLRAQIAVSPHVQQDIRKAFQTPISSNINQPIKANPERFASPSLPRVKTSESNLLSASTDFQSMNIRELLEYFLERNDKIADKAQFVHVTSRYNIDYVPKPNFYDLVVLEQPGHPHSGYVWTRDNPKYSNNYHVLPSHMIMQLSLKGLLVASEEYGVVRSEIIPLTTFFFEKDQFDQLRKLRYFGYFKELKVFKAWHHYTQRTYIMRMKAVLVKDTYFSDVELLKMQRDIAEATYSMEIELDLFKFHGRGAICITDFFKLQLQHIDEIKKQLHERISMLGDVVERQYQTFLHGKKLEDLIQEVKDHHPLRDEMLMQKPDSGAGDEHTGEQVDWIRLRSIQRLSDNFLAKVKNLMRMAQYRIESNISLLLEKFWLRFKQFVVGVEDLRKSNPRRREIADCWEIDYDLFNPNGSFRSNAFQHNIALYEQQNIKLDDEGEEVGLDHLRHDVKTIEEEDAKIDIFQGPSCFAKVKKDWENLGSHLCVRVELNYRDHIAELNDFIGLQNIDQLSVSITPSKSILLSQIHQICGSLGRLIENLPDLNKHKLVYVPEYRPVYVEPEVDLGLGELSNSNSSIYFTTLIMKPIFNSRNAYQLAVDSICLVNQAYNEATNIDAFTFKLFEIVRKLWSLSPASVVRQIDRSLTVPKIRTFIDQPDSVEDLKRSQLRDKSRLNSFKNASVYIEKLPKELEKYDNLKHRIGFITCFVPFIEQISAFRAIQFHYLSHRLPSSYATRCTIFYEFLRKIESIFDVQNKAIIELVEFMRKLKHFDAVKEYFDGEIEFCETMYHTILMTESSQNQGNLSLQELKISNLLSNKTRSHAPTVSYDKLHRVFEETLERITLNMSKLRSYLLTQLADVRELILMGRQKIRYSIAAVVERINEFQFVIDDDDQVQYNERESTIKNNEISGFASEINKIRKQVDASLAAQLLMLEAHDIVGAANAILLPSQVDYFNEVESLETVFSTKCQVGDILKRIESLNELLWSSRMNSLHTKEVNQSFANIVMIFTTLQANLDDDALLATIEKKIKKLSPRVELAIYLSSKNVKSRHWQLLATHVLKHCGLEIKLSGRQSEFVALVDITGREPVNMGNVVRLVVKDFFSRNVHKHLGKIKFIISEAVIESFLENTLDSVDNFLKIVSVHISSDWVKDSRLRERISIELGEITNIIPLCVLSKFCWKAIMMAEATSQDMGLTTFDHRIFKMKDLLSKIEKFLEHYQEIQYWWMYALHFVKFTARGEIDRDSIRSFNTVTEDMKKIEGILYQKSGNVYSAFASASEADMATENIRSNLNSILDDIHSSVQSLIDSCPRLTLLSYSRLVELYRVWLLGPQFYIDFVSLCIREMFEGVGELQISLLHSQKIYVCNGFISAGLLDKVNFIEPISFSLTLDDFVRSFATRIKQCIEKSCDIIMVHRINCMKVLLTSASVDIVLSNMHSLLQLRGEHLEALLSNETVLTSTLLLANQVSFAEDIWTCLGHPSGSFTMARPDLLIENVAFMKVWQELLGHFINCCENNIIKLQHHLLVVKSSNRINLRKIKSVLSGWIAQEFEFLDIAKDLSKCERVESATEAWMGHYQLRYQYAKVQRYEHCSIDVLVGNIVVCYGMEYQEMGMVTIHHRDLNYALGQVLSSAFCSRASTIVHSTENIAHPLINNHEISVTGKDIALALGRIPITLTNASQLSNVKQFFSKIVLLNAIGCIDFTLISQNSLQNIINTAQLFWSALDSKNDQVIQDSLKFPLRSRFSRNELHAERRKSALKTFYNDAYVKQKLHSYINFILVGFSTDTDFTDLAVVNQYYRSVFDVLTLPFNSSFIEIGRLLSSVGFLFGFDIQESFLSSLSNICKKAESDKDFDLELLQQLCSSNEVLKLVEKCRLSLSLFSRVDPIDIPKLSVGKSPKLIERYKEEVICFCGNLWDHIITLGCTRHIDYKKLHRELFANFLNKLEPMGIIDQVKALNNSIDSEMLQMRDQTVFSVIKSANSLGYICRHKFVQYCASLMERLLNNETPVTFLTGDYASGKTSILLSVVKAVKELKTDYYLNSRSLPVKYRLAAKQIYSCLKRWHLYCVKQRKLEAQLGLNDMATSNLNEISASIEESRTTLKTSRLSSPRQTRIRVVGRESIGKMKNVTVLYHGSLSTANLFGTFDSQGRWLDGILVRKLRNIDGAIAQEDFLRNGSDGISKKHGPSGNEYQFIVLSGPVSSVLQEFLHGFLFQSPQSVYPTFHTSYSQSLKLLTLPTNENFYVSDRLKIIIETSDLSSLSPSLLPMLPNIHITYSAVDIFQRVSTVWMRSVYHWLGDFPPWLDFLEELNNLLVSSKFIADLLYESLNQEKVQLSFVNSTLGSFFRLLEELLLQTHELALAQSSFTINVEKEVATDSSSEDEDVPVSNFPSMTGSGYMRPRGESMDSTKHSEIGNFKYIGSMSLQTKGREYLLKRARLAIIYAAIWGFGGAHNSTEKRKFFDGVLRDAVQHHMDPDISIPSEVLVFDLLMDVNKATLVPSTESSKEELVLLTKSGLSQKYLEQYVYCKFVEGHKSDEHQNVDSRNRLVFTTMSSRSVLAACKLFASAGANLMLLGSKGSGKSSLIRDILNNLKRSIPNPSALRQQIIGNLLDIASEVTKPKGIFRALEIVRTILIQSSNNQDIGNLEGKILTDQSFNDLWRNLVKDLEAYFSGSSRINCRAEAVSSANTSLAAQTGAHSLRRWFEREFATEVPNVLETERFTYGIAFIDDLHYLSTTTNAEVKAIQVNDRIEDLLKGVLHDYPLFGIERNCAVRSVMTFGNHLGSNDGSFKLSNGQPPIFHRENVSDPRLQMSSNDDYMLQRIGLFSAATGHIQDHLSSAWFLNLISHYAVLSLPSLSVSELHAAFITGAIVSMASAKVNFNLLEALQTEIAELSRVTLNTGLRMVSMADLMLTTSLERMLRTMTLLDLSFIARFNLSLRYGCLHVQNPGSLLQLYAHEWKRSMLDPLPDGAQKARIIGHMTEYIDNLDEKSWGVSQNWLKEMKDELQSNVDRVWTDSRILSSRFHLDLDKLNQKDEKNLEDIVDGSMSSYVPISLEMDTYLEMKKTAAWNSITRRYNPSKTINDLNVMRDSMVLKRDVDTSSLLTDYEASMLVYPAALSLLLRLVRILSVAGKHIILGGYSGSSKDSAIILAAKICNLVPVIFVAKDSQSLVDSYSEKAESSFDFRLFLKTATLKASGFTDPITLEDLDHNPEHRTNPNLMLNNVGLLQPGQVYFELIQPQKVLAIVSEVQQLSLEDRRRLISIIDNEDPTVLFNDAELIGMVEALRKDCKIKREEIMTIAQGKHLPTTKSDLSTALTPNTLDSTPVQKENTLSDVKGTGTKFFDSLMSPIEEISHSLDAVDDEMQIDENNATEPQSLIKSSSSASHKAKNVLSGYQFQWIKAYLKTHMQLYLHIAYLVDLPRTVEVHPNLFYSDKDCLALLRKLTGQAKHKNAKDHSSPRNKQSSTIDQSSTTTKTTSSARRFSMQSSKAGTNESGAKTIYTPNPGMVGGKNDTGTEENAVGENSASNSSTSLAPHGIFTCPILGPTLARRFHLVWYDVASQDCMNNICENIMQNVSYHHNKLSSDHKLIAILPLQSSAVGMYTVNNEPVTAPPPSGGNRRMSVAEKQALDKEEKRKKTFMFSDEKVSKYALVCFTDVNCSVYEERLFSMTKWFGVFNSFKLDATNSHIEGALDDIIGIYFEDAKTILSHLLQFPLPSDAVFLHDSIFTLGFETIAYRASATVKYIMYNFVRSMLKTKLIYKEVLHSIQASRSILDNDDHMDKKLILNNDELNQVMRNLSKEVDKIKKDTENVHTLFQKSEAYEAEQMLSEEIHAHFYHSVYFNKQVMERLFLLKKFIRSFTSQDWHTFSVFYGVKPTVSKHMIEIMRAVMVVINYSPPKILKGDRGSSSGTTKMDDDVVSKCAISLLLKPHDFVNQLCNVDALGLTATQFNALRIMNSLLNPNFVPYMNTEFYSPARRWELQQRLAGSDESADIIFDCLRQYLLTIDLHAVSANYYKEKKLITDAMEVELANIHASNEDQIRTVENQIKGELDGVIEQMTLIDGNIMNNRRKLDIIERNRKRKIVLLEGLYACGLFVESDYNKISNILNTVVADVCVSVTLLHRCGWLPESKRQDCLDILRRNLRKNNVSVSNTPFVSGCLVDRLHIRQMCGYLDSSPTYDVPTINAISLLFICPKHVLVIDPDGFAAQSLQECIPKHYDQHLVSAQKFSLLVFDNWVEASIEKRGSDSAICLILHDLQSGISDDLVCFLTSRLDYSKQDLQPTIVINSAHQYMAGNYKNNRITLPNSLKVIMLSTSPPTFDSFGCSSPLPVACMKDVTILHWSSIFSSTTVESKILEESCERRHMASNSLSIKLANKLIPMLTSSSGANNINMNLQQYNNGILSAAFELLSLERNLVKSLYDCIQADKESHSDKFSIDGMLEQTNVSLSILSYEHTIDAVISAVGKRKEYESELISMRTLSREYVAYLDTFQETFSMINDYIRLCGYLLPTQTIFSPQSLTAAAFIRHVMPSIQKFIHSHKLYSNKFPSSLYGAYRIFKGISSIQRLFRGRKHLKGSFRSLMPTSHNSSPSPFKKRESTVKFDAVSNKRMADESGRTIGLTPTLRQKAMPILHFFLTPLRPRLTTEILKYIEAQIQPGHEYMVKYLLFLATNLQSNQILDTSNEEIRTMFHLLYRKHGVNDARYIHLLPIPRNPNDKALKLLSNELLQDIKKVSETSNAASRNFTISSSENLLERGSGVMDGMYFNSRSILWKVKSTHGSKQESSGVGNIKTHTFSSVKYYDNTIYGKENTVLHGILMALDHCVDWAQHDQFAFNPVTFGDTYEVEYIKLCGVKAFHANNSLALLALGAGQKSIEEIDMARRLTVMQKPGINAFVRTKQRQSVLQSRKNSLLAGPRKRSMMAANVGSGNHSSIISINAMKRKNSMLLESSNKNNSFVSGNGRNDSLITTPRTSLIQQIMHTTISMRRASELKAGLVAISNAPTANMPMSSRRVSRRQTRISAVTVDSTESQAPSEGPKRTPVFSPVPNTSKQNAFSIQTVHMDDITEVLKDPMAYQALYMLESHPLLSPIYKGMTAYIGRNSADFLDWRDAINKLSTTPFHSYDKIGLLDLFSSVQPPMCLELDELGKGEEGKGLFLQGYELTVLQSFILAEALWPGSAIVMLELYYRVIAEYLNLGGYIILHNDEVLPEVESDEEEDEKPSQDRSRQKQSASDSEEDEGNDTFDTNQSDSTTGRLNSLAIRKASTSTFFRNLREYEDELDSQILVQDHIRNINSWFKVIHILDESNTGKYLILPEIVDFYGKMTYTLRDYYNWESICVEIFSVNYYDIEVNKFVYIKEMRRNILSASSSTHFITCHHFPVNVSSQLSLFSQRIRQYALVINRTVPIVHCDSSQSNNVESGHSAELKDYDSKNEIISKRSAYQDILKAIKLSLPNSGEKSSLNSSMVRKVVLEQVDISSINGLTLLTSLAPSATAAAPTHSNSAGAPTNSPYIVTSSWGTKNAQNFAQNIDTTKLTPYTSIQASAMAHHPPLSFVDRRYLWLPRYLAADLIHAGTRESASKEQDHKIITVPESYGLFYEELESSLLSVLTAHKYIKKLHITPEILRQLQIMNKVTLRMLASILVIAQSYYCLICQELEQTSNAALSGNWSNAMCNLNLWQLSRLLIKLQEIFQVKWILPSVSPGHVYTSQSFLDHPPYQKVIKVLVESLSRSDMDFYYSSASTVIDSGAQTKAELTNQLISRMKSTKSTPKTAANKAESATRREGGVVSTKSAIAQAAPVANTSSASARSKSLRAQKQLKKAMKMMEEYRLQYLNQLSNTRALQQMKSVSSPAEIDRHTLKHIQDVKRKHQEALKNYITVYVAEIICRKNVHLIFTDTMQEDNKDGEKYPKRRVSAGLEQITQHILNARRHSTKMNIHSVITDMASSPRATQVISLHNKPPQQTVEDLIQKVGFKFGALDTMEAMQSLIQWTLDRSDNKDQTTKMSSDSNALDGRKLLRSIKRLSVSIQQGTLLNLGSK